MHHDLEFAPVHPRTDPQGLAEIRLLLAQCGLGLEEGIQVFMTCRAGGRLVACAGLEDNFVKCVAIAAEHRGGAVSLSLMHELTCLALDRGQAHLFLYTKPDNAPLFRGCGFHPLVKVPGWAALMENTPVGISGYAGRLRRLRHEGRKIGCIVLNANPFTLGHQHLLQTAAAACDWLHVFVVSENASAIQFQDRLRLVQAGARGIPRLTLHQGSRYMISKATFPSYFIKDQGIVETCNTAIDLLLFRQHIAPALGITHRFVGTEPFCRLTRKYNEDMRTWLEDPGLAAAPIKVVELPRLEVAGKPVSASEVRRLLKAGDFPRMAPLVPRATLDLMRERYSEVGNVSA
jgi:[citrate (pro-3S)-lyase] ligase